MALVMSVIIRSARYRCYDHVITAAALILAGYFMAQRSLHVFNFDKSVLKDNHEDTSKRKPFSGLGKPKRTILEDLVLNGKIPAIEKSSKVLNKMDSQGASTSVDTVSSDGNEIMSEDEFEDDAELSDFEPLQSNHNDSGISPDDTSDPVREPSTSVLTEPGQKPSGDEIKVALQEMKQMMKSLCEKVNTNEKNLNEIKDMYQRSDFVLLVLYVLLFAM